MISIIFSWNIPVFFIVINGAIIVIMIEKATRGMNLRYRPKVERENNFILDILAIYARGIIVTTLTSAVVAILKHMIKRILLDRYLARFDILIS